MYQPPRSYVPQVLAFVGVAVLLVTTCEGGMRHVRHEREARRQAGMRLAIARAEPILTAIRGYEKQHGKPPANLSDLKLSLPDPGPLARWRVDTIQGWDYRPQSPATESWVLLVWVKRDQTPNLGFGDCLAYHADQHYPEHLYGGVLERVGKWGYYWE